jgi:hypothetical protein
MILELLQSSASGAVVTVSEGATVFDGTSGNSEQP